MVSVVVDVAALGRPFDYIVPPELDGSVAIGTPVRVELHGRRLRGWVVADHVEPPAGIEPKPILAARGVGPPADVVALAAWASWRWAGPVSSFLATASAPRVVRAREVTSGRRHPVVASPGGGAVDVVDQALAAPRVRPAVVRLAPTLDGTRVVLEVLHRLGPTGALVLAPSRRQAEVLAGRLRAAGAPSALLPDEWAFARGGSAVAVGARGAAWAPLPAVRVVVVLDAHDEAYREERAPTWSAVDVAVERGRRAGAPVVLVTPCPTVVLTERARVVVTPRAVERRGWPEVVVVDRVGDDPRTGLFSERLVTEARAVLADPGGRVVCVLNRRGRARLLACAACGAVAACTRCGGAMELGASSEVLECRRCGEQRPVLCARCDSGRLKLLRPGVARAADELSRLLGQPVHEEAGPRSPATAHSVVGDDTGPDIGFPARVVVGTTAALYRSGPADLVAFLDFDQHLLARRFTAAEEALALLARAGRLVGGRGGRGRLLVQTRLGDHEVFEAVRRGDPSVVSESQRAVRRALDLPPFAALATLAGPGTAALAAALAAVPGVAVSTFDEDRVAVRAIDHVALCDALARAGRPGGKVRVAVDATDL
ncbi:MAG: hypothetical protein ACP5P9_00890 [Acidimicrobiales bacterium]